MTFKCIHCEDKYNEIDDGDPVVLRGICVACTRDRLGSDAEAEIKARLDHMRSE